MAKRILVLLVVMSIAGCSKDNTIIDATRPSPVGEPTPRTTNNPNSPVAVNKVEYRVTGNAMSARIRYSNVIDGSTQVVTTIPYTATFTSTESAIFVSLEATPIQYVNTLYPFFSVQIFVNGALFRESTSSDLFFTTISVSGTWRR